MLTPRVLITKITKGDNGAGIFAPIKAEEGTTNLIGTRPASPERDRKPDLATLTTLSKPASPRRIPKSSKLKVGSKSLAVGTSAPEHSRQDALVSVTLTDIKYNSVNIQARRSDRVAAVLKVYARMKSLNPESLSVSRFGKEVDPQVRFGTIVRRHLNCCWLDVVDADNPPDANPFSEYDSDS